MSDNMKHVNTAELNALRHRFAMKYPSLRPNNDDFDESIDGGIRYSNLPLPGVLRFAYCNVLGFHAEGPWEKIAWVIHGEAFGRKFRISFRKFGPRLSIEAPCDEDIVNQIKVMQIGLYKETIRYLRTLRDSMMDAGDFTIENKSLTLQSEYSFFRNHAFEAYRSNPPEATPIQCNGEDNPPILVFNPFLPKQKGGYLAKAALSSFASWIEHILVLLYPFSEDYQANEIKPFLKKTWGDKWKMIFSSEDEQAQRALNILKELAETYRNPFIHGSIKRGGESFAFHVPGAGAVTFLEDTERLEAENALAQISEECFKEIIRKQEEAIRLISESGLRLAWRYVSSGLNVACDQKSREKYLAAQESEAAMNLFIEQTAYLEDRYANMDF